MHSFPLTRRAGSFLAAAALLLALASSGSALRPGRWEFNQRGDYARSELKGFEVTYDGQLKLGVLASPTPIPAEYIWSIAEYPDVTFVGTGDGARIFAAANDGEGEESVSLAWQGAGQEVYALARLADGRLAAGVSALGRLLVFDRDGGQLTPAAAIDLPDSYIWRLLPVGEDLWIATGSGDATHGGALYRLRGGALTEVVRVDDQHILSLALVGDRLYAGTEGDDGVVLKVENLAAAAPVVTVACDPPEKEIVDLVADADGRVFVLAVGSRGARVGAPPARNGGGDEDEETDEESDEEDEAPAPRKPSSTTASNSMIYRLDTDGRIEEWIRARSLLRTGRLTGFGFLVGTANQANLFRVDGPLKSTLLASLDEKNILSLGERTVGTSEPAMLYRLRPAGAEAVWRSQPLDAGARSDWGVLSFYARGGWEIRTRSGNVESPNERWSPWSAPARSTGSRVESPSARYLQFEVRLPEGAEADYLSNLSISYNVENLAPRIGGVKMQKVAFTQANASKISRAGALGQLVSQYFQSARNVVKQKSDARNGLTIEDLMQPFAGLWQVEWEAEDPSGDKLLARIELIDQATKRAMVVGENIKENMFLLNTRNYPDGWYRVYVTVADDIESEFGDPIQSGEFSPPFLIDNTPPLITLRAEFDPDGKLAITGTARDELGYIAAVYYFDDQGVWQRLSSDDRLFDQPEEYFHFTPAGGLRTVIVKAVDQNGNLGFARINYRE